MIDWSVSGYFFFAGFCFACWVFSAVNKPTSTLRQLFSAMFLGVVIVCVHVLLSTSGFYLHYANLTGFMVPIIVLMGPLFKDLIKNLVRTTPLSGKEYTGVFFAAFVNNNLSVVLGMLGYTEAAHAWFNNAIILNYIIVIVYFLSPLHVLYIGWPKSSAVTPYRNKFLVGFCLFIASWLVILLYMDFSQSAQLHIGLSLFLFVIIAGLLLLYFYGEQARNHLNKELKDSQKHRKILEGLDVQVLINTLEKRLQLEQVYLEPELSVQSLADKLGVSKSVLSAIINDSYDMNFTRFVNQYRVEHAVRLIEKYPSRAIVDICFDSGFSTKSNFYRAFKEVCGKTPSEYRKLVSTSV